MHELDPLPLHNGQFFTSFLGTFPVLPLLACRHVIPLLTHELQTLLKFVKILRGQFKVRDEYCSSAAYDMIYENVCNGVCLHVS